MRGTIRASQNCADTIPRQCAGPAPLRAPCGIEHGEKLAQNRNDVDLEEQNRNDVDLEEQQNRKIDNRKPDDINRKPHDQGRWLFSFTVCSHSLGNTSLGFSHL